MRRLGPAGGVLLGVMLVSGYLYAQQMVDQGKPGTKGPWPVTCTNCSGGGGSVSFDGGNIGYMLMPDGGPLEVSIPGFVDVTQGSSPWLVASRDGGVVNQYLPPTGTTTRPGTAVDLDTSGATRWAQGVAITGFGFGAGNQLTADVYSIPPSGFSTGLGVREVHKTVSNPTTTSVTCATTATAITSLAYRTTLTLKNPADADVVVYIGGSGVTTANGFPLYPRESWQDTVADSTYYCRSGNPDGGTATLRVLQN